MGGRRTRSSKDKKMFFFFVILVSFAVRWVLMNMMNNPGVEAAVHHIKQGCFFGQIVFEPVQLFSINPIGPYEYMTGALRYAFIS
jgi:hypothetical protein